LPLIEVAIERAARVRWNVSAAHRRDLQFCDEQLAENACGLFPEQPVAQVHEDDASVIHCAADVEALAGPTEEIADEPRSQESPQPVNEREAGVLRITFVG